MRPAKAWAVVFNRRLVRVDSGKTAVPLAVFRSKAKALAAARLPNNFGLVRVVRVLIQEVRP